MCLAIYKPAGKVVTEAQIREGAKGNNDGYGFCYATGDHFMALKEHDLDNFITQLKKDMDKALLIHLRKATHGLKDTENMHPWFFGTTKKNHWAVIHNGILSCTSGAANAQLSDTGVFVHKVLQPLFAKGFDLMDDQLLNLLLMAIGTCNKMVLMDVTGRVAILNEAAGHWREGVWFSNHSYAPLVATTSYTGYSSNSSTYGADNRPYAQCVAALMKTGSGISLEEAQNIIAKQWGWY